MLLQFYKNIINTSTKFYYQEGFKKKKKKKISNSFIF